jgi:hypothetical protein
MLAGVWGESSFRAERKDAKVSIKRGGGVVRGAAVGRVQGGGRRGGAANAGAAAGATDEKGVRRVGPAELQKMMDSGEAVAVDVRPKAEYDNGHIKGSVSIPRSELPQRLGELPKDKLVVFYCA